MIPEEGWRTMMRGVQVGSGDGGRGKQKDSAEMEEVYKKRKIFQIFSRSS